MLSQRVVQSGRGVAGSAFFTGGMESQHDPMFIGDRAYRHGQNVLNRGGVLRTRPGYRSVYTLPEGKPQGLFYFRPIRGEGHLAVAVAGQVFVAPYPFKAFTRLPGIQLYPKAERVWFEQTTSSAIRNADGTIQTVEPRTTLLVSDGGYTRTAYWDGVVNGHADPTMVADAEGTVLSRGVPLCGPMCWSGDRLWVAAGNKVFAGDIANPLSFTENEYAADGGFFLFDDDVVAMANIPSLADPVMLVFTANSTYRILTGIQTRSEWKATKDFKSEFLPGVGCTSDRAVVAANGLLWWMSPDGLTNLNVAQQSQVSSVMPPQDTEMALSKFNLSPNLRGVAMGAHGNFMVCSVPYADRRNTHTWVLDTSVTSGKGGPTQAWAGIWTGTRPVEWASGRFAGTRRTFFLSEDYDGLNRVWEAFDTRRTDNGAPVGCFVETKTHLNFSEKASGLDRKQFIFAETTFSDIVGDVSVQVYWAGTRGKYKLLAEHTLSAASAGVSAVDYTAVTSSRPQGRVLRTPEVKKDPSSACTARGTESENADWIDVGFSLLIVWQGQAALRSYRIFADPFDEPDSGRAEVDEATPRVASGAICE